MNSKIIELLQENNKLLKEISSKLTQKSQHTSINSFEDISNLSGDILIALGQQYMENPDIMCNETATAYVVDGNLRIKSSVGQINANLNEKNVKSSFIDKIYVTNNTLYVKFKSNKTYKYTSKDHDLFDEVVDQLMTASRVSKPFLELVRDNPAFNYAQVA